MPCFHFDVRGEDPSHPGATLAGIHEARVEAVRLAGDILSEAPAEFWAGKAFDLDVCNCDRQVLFTLSMNCHDGPPGVRPAAACPEEDEG